MALVHPYILELFKTALAASLLGLTWFVGQRIIAEWDLRKKRREEDAQTIRSFQEGIGEWKALWRSWKVYKSHLGNGFTTSEHTRWTLLDRAAQAEGKIEAILTRAVMEKCLGECELIELGLFRQTFQQLREAIRDDASMKWNRDSKEYWVLHDLLVRVASILDRPLVEPKPTPTDGQHQLRRMLRVDFTDWNAAVAKSHLPT